MNRVRFWMIFYSVFFAGPIWEGGEITEEQPGKDGNMHDLTPDLISQTSHAVFSFSLLTCLWKLIDQNGLFGI